MKLFFEDEDPKKTSEEKAFGSIPPEIKAKLGENKFEAFKIIYPFLVQEFQDKWDKLSEQRLEKLAFELIDPGKNPQFDEDKFKAFKVAWSFVVVPKMRADLSVQLLERLDFPLQAHRIRVNTGVRTSSLYQDFVMRTILNQCADICNLKFDDYESIGALVSYLQLALNSTFLNKLKKVSDTLGQIDPDSDETAASPVPLVPPDTLTTVFNDLRNTCNEVIKDLLDYEKNKDPYDLFYAHVVEGKTFVAIAQDFNKRNNVDLTAGAYNARFNVIINDLKNYGKLEQFNNDLNRLRDQIDNFGAQFKKPSDPLKLLKKDVDKCKVWLNKYNAPDSETSAQQAQLKKDAEQLEVRLNNFDSQDSDVTLNLIQLFQEVEQLAARTVRLVKGK